MEAPKERLLSKVGTGFVKLSFHNSLGNSLDENSNTIPFYAFFVLSPIPALEK